jgi:hypothetical protein
MTRGTLTRTLPAGRLSKALGGNRVPPSRRDDAPRVFPLEILDDDDRTRSACREHDPHPEHGRGAGSQLRSPGHADGAWRPWPTRCGSSSWLSIPQDPIWPNRDRFVLSMGHASMLLYSMLHLTAGQGGQPEVRTAGRGVGRARRHQEVPPARQPLRRPPRVPLDLGRRDHHGPARAGRRHVRRHGDRSAGWRTHYNKPGFDLFDYDVYALAAMAA